jgi:hypothetical protein
MKNKITNFQKLLFLQTRYAKERSVKNFIKQLIASKKEGEWWDFKREHHKSSLDLLHDILCLSNALHPGDRYLIIGVSDDYELFDVKCNSPRRTQADIVDLLKRKNFAENNIPAISMANVTIDGNELDVIIIKNERVKPYYLLGDVKKERKILRSGVVYTREGDTNTPIDMCANPKDVAMMWRERFGLTLSAEERFIDLLLEFENWRYDGISKAHYSIDPDYSIEIEEVESNQGKYWWQIDSFKKPYKSIYILKYRDKELYKVPVLHFHSENLCFPFPNIEYIAYPDDQVTGITCYCDLFHYVKGTIEYSLLVHIRAMEIGAKLTEHSLATPLRTQIKPPIISLPFVLFDNQNERDKAIEQLKQNIKEFKKLTEGNDECEKLFSEWAYDQICGA